MMNKLLVAIMLCIPSVCYSFNDFSSGLMNTPIATTGRTGKVTVDNKTMGIDIHGVISKIEAYGEIYTADVNTAQSIANGATYVKITPFTVNGLSINATSDHANDKITVTKTGKYLVSFYFSSVVAANDVNLYTAIFINGVEASNIHSLRNTKASTVSVSASEGIVSVTAGQDVDIRCRHDYGSAISMTVIYGNLHLRYIGE